jgi:hypothetical protein
MTEAEALRQKRQCRFCAGRLGRPGDARQPRHPLRELPRPLEAGNEAVLELDNWRIAATLADGGAQAACSRRSATVRVDVGTAYMLLASAFPNVPLPWEIPDAAASASPQG